MLSRDSVPMPANWHMKSRSAAESDLRPPRSNAPPDQVRTSASSSMTSTPSSRACLSFEPAPGPGDDEVGLLRHRARDLGAEPLGQRLGLVAGHLLQRAGEDHGLAGDRRMRRRRRASAATVDLAPAARRAASQLCGSAKKSRSRSATDVADAVDGVEVVLGASPRVARRPPSRRREGARQEP